MVCLNTHSKFSKRVSYQLWRNINVNGLLIVFEIVRFKLIINLHIFFAASHNSLFVLIVVLGLALITWSKSLVVTPIWFPQSPDGYFVIVYRRGCIRLLQTNSSNLYGGSTKALWDHNESIKLICDIQASWRGKRIYWYSGSEQQESRGESKWKYLGPWLQGALWCTLNGILLMLQQRWFGTLTVYGSLPDPLLIYSHFKLLISLSRLYTLAQIYK